MKKKSYKNLKKYMRTWISCMGICLLLTACSNQPESYSTYEIPKQSESDIKPVSSFYVEGSYEGIEPKVQLWSLIYMKM